MAPLTRKQIDNAIARLPQQSNKAIETVRANASRLACEELVEAAARELHLRGSLVFDEAEAKRIAELSATLEGKTLHDVILRAFTDIPAKPEERLILAWIARHPGRPFRELLAAYGKRDLSLVIGHLAYYRFGYFRPFFESNTQSDVLLQRHSTPDGVSYALRPEAAAAFRAIGVFDATD
jgi:hypothetical protein